MKRNTKLFSLLLSLVLTVSLISCLAISASAETEPQGPLEWSTVDDKTTTITDGANRYTFKGTLTDHDLAGEIYCYYNKVTIGNSQYSVYAPSPDSPIRYIVKDGIIKVYLMEGSDPSVFGGSVAYCYTFVRLGVDDSAWRFESPDGLIESLALNTDVETVEVADLSGNLIYTLYTYDATDTLSYTYGGFYTLGEDTYFVNYTTLDNSYFDSEGNFSYRQGNVLASKIGQDTLQSIVAGEEYSYYASVNYIYESYLGDFDDNTDYPYDEGDKSSPIVTTIIILVLIGFAPSCAIIAFSLRKLLRTNKEHRDVGLYLILSSGAVWLVCSIIVAFIIYI